MSDDQSAAAGTALEPGDFAEAAEPFALFDTWLADATRREPNDPNAMALATVDAAGHPNVRMVLLKAVDEPSSTWAASANAVATTVARVSSEECELMTLSLDADDATIRDLRCDLS